MKELGTCTNANVHRFAHCECEVRQLLKEQKAEFIALIKQKRDEIDNDPTPDYEGILASQIYVLDELLKELEG